jgi:hypothetical protein
MDLKWFKGLIALFPKLKDFRDISISLIKIVVTNNDNRKVILHGNEASIFWNTLDKKEKDKFVNEIPKALNVGKTPLMIQEYENLAKDIEENTGGATEAKLISYFSGKIPADDLYVLKASVYIKKVFDRGGDIEGLKSDIRYRYGKRGNNICNLYSAGYFESWIKPLYGNLSSTEGFTNQTFLEAYNLVVETYPFAIFVHHAMTAAEIEEQAAIKIKVCRMYGIKTLSIHGIGSDNVHTISTALEAIKEKYKFETDIEGKGSLMVAKINIKE